MSWIKKLLGIKPNDWTPVWSENAYWNIANVLRPIFDDVITRRQECFYVIEHSKSRKRYRITTEGYKPKEHRYYGHVLKTLTEYNTQTHGQ